MSHGKKMTGKFLRAKIVQLEATADRLTDYFTKATVADITVVRAQYDDLVEFKADIRTLYDDVHKYNSSSATKDVIDYAATYEAFTASFIQCKSKFLELDAAHRQANANVPATGTSMQPASTVRGPKMPDIKISPFNGDISRYKSFISMYNGLVHNVSTYSDEQKFYFFKSYLTPEGSKIIDNLLEDPANYHVAYSAFTNYYSSARRLANYYLNDILKFRKRGNLFEFLTTHRNAYRGLCNLNINNLAEYIILHLSYLNLEDYHREKFDLEAGAAIPDIDSFFKFIEKYLKAEELKADCPGDPETSTTPNFQRTFVTTDSRGRRSQSSGCIVFGCNSQHKLTECEKFIAFKPQKRFKLVKKFHYCFKCLANHKFKDCPETISCSHCHKQHHDLIHFGKLTDMSSSGAGSQTSTSTVNACCLLPEVGAERCLQVSCNQQLLLTAEVLYTDDRGQDHKLRALLDNGSQVNLITTAAATRLGLPIMPGVKVIAGITQQTSSCVGSTTFIIRSHSAIKDPFSMEITADVIERITQDLPYGQLPFHIRRDFKHLPLADPFFWKEAPVDLLLNVDVFNQVLTSISPGYPSRVNSRLGVMVSGSLYPPSAAGLQSPQCLLTRDVSTNLERLWNQQEGDLQLPDFSEIDHCEAHFQRTVQRDDDGRYQVSYPFKENPPRLGSNRASALSNYRRLEASLQADSDLAMQYHAYMQSLFDAGYLEESTKANDYILPQNIVLSPDSSTTKCRVVWNASSQSNFKTSLNDAMFTGSNLLKRVEDVLFHFRLHEIWLIADIRRCYFQIRVDRASAELQTLFYRKTPSDPLKEYHLRVLAFGTRAAPYLCNRTLQKLATDHETEFPRFPRSPAGGMWNKLLLYVRN